jgi:transposase
VDFRRGADSLAAVVCEQLQCDPFSGTIFIFRSRRADRLKSAFRWPPISDGVMRLTSAQLAVLVDGMDWSRLHARDVVRPTAVS